MSKKKNDVIAKISQTQPEQSIFETIAQDSNQSIFVEKSKFEPKESPFKSSLKVEGNSLGKSQFTFSDDLSFKKPFTPNIIKNFRTSSSSLSYLIDSDATNIKMSDLASSQDQLFKAFSEKAMINFSEHSVSSFPIATASLSRKNPVGSSQLITSESRSKSNRNEVYKSNVRNDLVNSFTDDGYVDDFGYVVKFKGCNGSKDGIGEATLHTAIAIIALASGNYNRDQWEKLNANSHIQGFLETLLTHSWGNRDSLNREHPIRHPEDIDYAADGSEIRKAPLSKDSFGAIMAACYYSYDCPHTSVAVKQKARDLFQKWMDYLIAFQWRTHSSTHPSYFEGEWEKHNCNSGGKECDYKNIYSDRNKGSKSFKGPETFILLPHEIYSLKNVGTKLGYITADINPWTTSLPASLQQTLVDYVTPHIVKQASALFEYIIYRIGDWEVPYSIDLGFGNNWYHGKIEGDFSIGVFTDSFKRNLVNEFQNVLSDAIRETFRLIIAGNHQTPEIFDLVLNRVLDLLPDVLGRDSWKSIMLGSFQQLLPWLNGEKWLEFASYYATILFLERKFSTFVVNYSVWSIAVSCEIDPLLNTLLRSPLEGLYRSSDGKNHPYTILAWLINNDAVVENHLQIFENNDPLAWDKYAFDSTEFNIWKNEKVILPPGTERCDFDIIHRLDYLICEGLYEKGSPSLAQEVVESWWKNFLGYADELLQNSLKGIEEQIFNGGVFERILPAGSHRVIKEIWNSNGSFIREIYDNGVLTNKVFSDVNGLYKIWQWDAIGTFISYKQWKNIMPDGTLLNTDLIESVFRDAGRLRKIIWNNNAVVLVEEWWKSKLDGSTIANDLESRIKRGADGLLEKWTWARDGSITSYNKWWKSTINGGADAVDALERFVRNSNGYVTRILFEKGGAFKERLEYFTSDKLGKVLDINLSKVLTRDKATKELKRWIYEKGKILKTYHRWYTSTVDGLALPEDIDYRLKRAADGVVEDLKYYRDGALEFANKWLKSDIAGNVEIDSQIYSIARKVNGYIKEINWATNGALLRVSEWWRSTKDGLAVADDLVRKLEREISGKLTEIQYQTNKTLKSFFVWSNSNLAGGAIADDMTEKTVRYLGGKLEKSIWDNGKYINTVWSNSTALGAAIPEDVVERYTENIDGTKLYETWEKTGKYTKTVYDVLGNIISGARRHLPDWPPTIKIPLL